MSPKEAKRMFLTPARKILIFSHQESFNQTPRKVRVLASLKVLFLLYDSIMSTKEAKRTFLTPSRMILTFFSSGINLLDPKGGSYKFLNS
jgi:hypothetical protein